MRIIAIALPLILLAGCETSPASPDGAAMAAPAPFTAPMDPGQISCRDMANPTAVANATEWALGQARAAVMSGRAASAPPPASVSATLSSYCASNPSNSVSGALAQIGA